MPQTAAAAVTSTVTSTVTAAPVTASVYMMAPPCGSFVVTATHIG